MCNYTKYKKYIHIYKVNLIILVQSYRMCVRKGQDDWFVFHTEEQILNLAKTLHKVYYLFSFHFSIL